MVNRRARYNYEILEEFRAGIVLTGPEIKSLRQGLSNINDSYCLIINNEVFIKDMYIGKYDHDFSKTSTERRDRKLLLTKKEIKRLSTKLIYKGLTIIPLSVKFEKYAKVQIGLAKGKKNYDKRESIKKREVERNLRRII
jgi:SsrA-binding protein